MNTTLLCATLWVVYFLLIVACTKSLLLWYRQNHWFSVNYRGERIVQAFGLNFFFHYVLYYVLLLCFLLVPGRLESLSFRQLQLWQEDVLIFLVVLGILSLIGWLDDHFGENQIKGFRGHFVTLFREKRITSGMLKAFYGLLVALFCTFFYQQGLLHWLTSSSLVLFSIHFFNLLDVRPGRAIKGFWLLLAFTLPFLSFFSLLFFIVPIVLSTVVLFQYDRKCVVMLGDTGSNVLGGIFGFILMLHIPVSLQLVYVVLFIGLAFFAEKYSFSAVIKKNPLLSRIDNWGIQ